MTFCGLALAPDVTPLDRTVHPVGDALAFGVLLGCLTFALLARRRVPVASIARVPPRRLLARSLVLAVRSAEEEAIWRAFVLGALVGLFGRLCGLAVSSVLFAAAHVGRLGRGALTHLVTGSAFGLAYVTTGRLHAAIAAHGTYNVLVGAAALGEDVSVSATRRDIRPVVASNRASDRRPPSSRGASLSTAPVAVLEGVSKSFGAVRALDRVDLRVDAGEVVALLGPNGAGKSTAVAIMLGLRRPDSGRARLYGRDPRDVAARRSLGAALQDVGFPPGLRVAETVELVRAHFPGAVSTHAALDRLGLATVARRDAGGLSGGQRRRLAVALSLTGNPKLLFLDEPTAGMDAAARRRLLRDVATFAQAGGAVLLTTQQLAEAEEIATRVVLLTTGRVVLEGTVAEVRARGGLTKVTLRAPSPPPLASATAVDAHGEKYVVYVDDADAFVAELVRSGLDFRDLEVVPVTLEDAFVALTGGSAA